MLLRNKFKGLTIVLFLIGFAGLTFYLFNLPGTYLIPLDRTLDQAIIANGSRIIENSDGAPIFRDVKKYILYIDACDFLAEVGKNQSITKVISASRKYKFDDVTVETKYFCYLPMNILIEHDTIESRECSFWADANSVSIVSGAGILLANDQYGEGAIYILGIVVIAIVAYMIAAIIEWLAGFLTRMRREAKIWFASNWPRNKD